MQVPQCSATASGSRCLLARRLLPQMPAPAPLPLLLALPPPPPPLLLPPRLAVPPTPEPEPQPQPQLAMWRWQPRRPRRSPQHGAWQPAPRGRRDVLRCPRHPRRQRRWQRQWRSWAQQTPSPRPRPRSPVSRSPKQRRAPRAPPRPSPSCAPLPRKPPRAVRARGAWGQAAVAGCPGAMRGATLGAATRRADASATVGGVRGHGRRCRSPGRVAPPPSLSLLLLLLLLLLVVLVQAPSSPPPLRQLWRAPGARWPPPRSAPPRPPRLVRALAARLGAVPFSHQGTRK